VKEKGRQPLFEGAGSFLIIVFSRKFHVQILPIFLKELINIFEIINNIFKRIEAGLRDLLEKQS